LGIEPAYIQAGAVALASLVLILIFRAKRYHALELLLVFALVAGAVYFFGVEKPLLSSIKLGRELKGGTVLTLQAVETPESPVTLERLETAVRQINERVDRLGVSEAEVSLRPAEQRIAVDLPSVSREEAMDIVQPCRAILLRLGQQPLQLIHILQPRCTIPLRLGQESL